MGSFLPSVKEPISDPGTGSISAAWYRMLARFERLLNGATTTPGTGLDVSTSGALEIADGGVTDAKLRDSLALSIIGRPLSSDGTPQDIVAGTNEQVLQRVGDQLVFGYIQLAGFTVATVPRAGNYPQGLIYVSDEAGGATLAFSDSTNWRRVQDRAVIS